MPRRKVFTPGYSFNKASKQAVVYLNGRSHYLGPWQSPSSVGEYNRLVGLWLSGGGRLPEPADAAGPAAGLTVNEVLLQYLSFADGYYVKGGRPTSEADDVRLATRPLVDLYGVTPVNEFGPRCLKAVRERMVQAGWCRNYVNQQVGRVKRFFKWATENEFVRGDVFYALSAVAGLRRGRCGARETEPVRPVPDADVDAVLSRVSPRVRAMIELQLLTGMRPESVVIMRSCDVDTSSNVWVYRPSTHKTEHHGKQLLVHLGPKAKAVLQPYLRPDLDAYVFSPREAEDARNAEKRRNRGTPMTPSQAGRTPKAGRGRPPGDRYSVGSYRRAIARACKDAGVPAWSPGRLRHNAATRLRKEFGLEAAQVVLGHQTAAVTQIYAERDHAKAAEIMTRVG